MERKAEEESSPFLLVFIAIFATLFCVSIFCSFFSCLLFLRRQTKQMEGRRRNYVTGTQNYDENSLPVPQRKSSSSLTGRKERRNSSRRMAGSYSKKRRSSSLVSAQTQQTVAFSTSSSGYGMVISFCVFSAVPFFAWILRFFFFCFVVFFIFFAVLLASSFGVCFSFRSIFFRVMFHYCHPPSFLCGSFFVFLFS